MDDDESGEAPGRARLARWPQSLFCRVGVEEEAFPLGGLCEVEEEGEEEQEQKGQREARIQSETRTAHQSRHDVDSYPPACDQCP